LTELYIYCIVNQTQLAHIIKNLPQLKRLTISIELDFGDNEDDVQLPTHNNLESLTCGYNDEEEDFIETHEVLLAFPSLKLLTVAEWEIEEATISFLGKTYNENILNFI
jgi:hypothetical protein